MTQLATRQQRMAEIAFATVQKRKKGNWSKEYRSFAKSFPSLIHSTGLCQAVAFAQAKGKENGSQTQVCLDVVTVMGLVGGVAQLAEEARTCQVVQYMRLTRIALQSATWIKRYVEALDEPQNNQPSATGETVT